MNVRGTTKRRYPRKARVRRTTKGSVAYFAEMIHLSFEVANPAGIATFRSNKLNFTFRTINYINKKHLTAQSSVIEIHRSCGKLTNHSVWWNELKYHAKYKTAK